MAALHWAQFPFVGGVERHLETILPQIAKAGVNISALSGRYPGEPLSAITQGVNQQRSELLLLQHIKENRDQIQPEQLVAMYRQFIDTTKPEVLFAHNQHFGYPEYAGALLDLTKEKGIPAAIVLHNDIFVGRDYSETKSIVAMPWDRVVSISLYLTAVTIQEHPNFLGNHIETIPHGIDTDMFRPLTADERKAERAKHGWGDRPIVINHSKMIEKKGTLETVLAIAQVKENHPEVLLLLCGGTPAIADSGQAQQYWAEIQSAIREHGLEKNILIQKYHPDEIPTIVGLCDVAIQSSIKHEEPFGLCPVEAMACAVPVIATRSGGIPESIVDQQTGFIIEKEPLADVPQAIASRLDLLLSNGNLRNMMGQAGRARVMADFTKKIMADRFIESANGLLNDAR